MTRSNSPAPHPNTSAVTTIPTSAATTMAAPSTSTPFAAALGYAQRGWPVLPLRAGQKVPLTDHGFKDASADPDQLCRWWERWPQANLGISTGEAGLLVIDVDSHHGADLEAWINGRPWPETFTVETGRGGRHFYFAQPSIPLRCTAGVLAPHIDTRGVGGYVVAAPSTTSAPYTVVHDLPVATLPDWIVHALDTPTSRQLTAPDPLPWVTAYGSKVLDAESNALATTTSGRNAKLNAVAFRCGQLIARGHLDRSTVEARLTAAAHRSSSLGDHPLTDREIADTLRSGIEAGLLCPALTPTAPPPPAPAPELPSLTLISTPIEAFTGRPPEFAWGNRLTLGGLTILAGDGGIGKSFLTTSLAVAFARGDGLPDQGPTDRGSTVIITYEDPGEILYQRARAMGYDPAATEHGTIEVIYAPEAFRDADGHPQQLTPHHVRAVSDLLANRDDLRLVVIDPLMSFVGADVDTNKDQQVRAVLHKLTALADDHGIAVVVVAHTVKGTPDPSRALDAIAGSAGIKNIARSALIALRDEEAGRHYIFHRKHNWTSRAQALEYRFHDGVFEWVGPVEDAMLQRVCERRTRSPFDRCAEWLIELLQGGPVPVPEVMAAGKAQGYGEHTIRSAQRQLQVRSRKVGFQGPSYWELPADGV